MIVIQVTAPEEEDFPFKHPTQFRNLERRGHEILADPHRLRELYLDRFRSFREQLVKHCGSAGIDLLCVSTSQPYQKILGEFLAMRARRKRQR